MKTKTTKTTKTANPKTSPKPDGRRRIRDYKLSPACILFVGQRGEFGSRYFRVYSPSGWQSVDYVAIGSTIYVPISFNLDEHGRLVRVVLDTDPKLKPSDLKDAVVRYVHPDLTKPIPSRPQVEDGHCPPERLFPGDYVSIKDAWYRVFGVTKESPTIMGHVRLDLLIPGDQTKLEHFDLPRKELLKYKGIRMAEDPAYM